MRTKALVILICSYILCYSQNVLFKTISLEEALELSNKEKKPVFIDFYASWCGPCKLMDKKTFSNEEVATYMNTNFINIKIDVDDKASSKVVNELNISEVPTFIVMDSQKKVIKRLKGYYSDKKFLKEISE
jgi:thiol:disulfide interchange protein